MQSIKSNKNNSFSHAKFGHGYPSWRNRGYWSENYYGFYPRYPIGIYGTFPYLYRGDSSPDCVVSTELAICDGNRPNKIAMNLNSQGKYDVFMCCSNP